MQLSEPTHALSLLTAAALLAPTSFASPDATSTRLVSQSTGGTIGNATSGTGAARAIAVSDSGRFVAFTSEAQNLVPGDTNLRRDVFLRDRELETTVRVSVGDQGQQGNELCEGVAVSNDGRFVAFGSLSSNLVPNDTNGVMDVFLWDATTGTSRLVSHGSTGASGNNISEWPSMDALGRRVVFQSRASDLVAGDANGFQDVFVWERTTDTVELVSVSSAGDPATGFSTAPYLARDGRYIAFATGATWDPMDPNNLHDIYVRDLVAGTTELVAGRPGGYNGAFREPAVSMCGRYVTFATAATNLLPSNTNGRNDVFRFDRQTDTIVQVSLATNGDQPNDHSYAGDISVDGAWVAFVSEATNIDPNVTAAASLFVRRVDQEWTELLSISHSGAPLVFPAVEPAIAGDGRFVCFRSGDPGVVPNDTNGTNDVVIRDRGFGSRSAGGTYCLSTINSSGEAGEIIVAGSNKLSTQTLFLRAQSLPQNSLGYFLFSETAGDVPGFGGSQGRLCLGGTIFRLSNFIQSSGGSGAVTLPFPFGQLPPAAQLSVGDTWHFQYWFRDVAGGQATSNTSSAVCVPLY